MLLLFAAHSALIAVFDEERPLPTLRSARFEAPAFVLGPPNWRPWEEGVESRKPRKNILRQKSPAASATVEVVDEAVDRAERLMEFNSRMAPQLRLAYDRGYETRTNKQMLAEFMMMDPAHPHPPTIPSVFYNNFKPPEENPALKEMKKK